jgi:P2 family phage contractile tail tube protein
MATTIIYKFEAAAVWLNGTSLAGSIKEIEMPELAWDSVDHETIALFGTPQYASKLQALEVTISWASYTPELAAAAANPFKVAQLQVRGNWAEYRADGKFADRLGKIDLSGRFLSNSLGTHSPGESERESMIAIDSVKETWDGQVMLEVSLNPPVFRAGGIDLMAGRRKNLGL